MDSPGRHQELPDVPPGPRGVGDQAFWLDAAVIGLVSLAIITVADRLALMTALVPAILLGRFVVLARLSPAERLPMGAEVLFFLLCTLLGAFNDWSSVVRHGIYDYDLPHYRPDLSTIPFWMLLYWGMILRFVTRLTRWRRLDPPDEPEDRVWLPGRVVRSAPARVAVLLVLVLATRQCIYRFYADPVLSWLPFALVLGVWAALLRPSRHDKRLALIFLIGGPLIEVLYINVGHLHHYGLGWFGGVPLWIVLWWVLAVSVWKDLSLRILRRLVRPGAQATAHVAGGV